MLSIIPDQRIISCTRHADGVAGSNDRHVPVRLPRLSAGEGAWMAVDYRFSFGPWNIHEGADPFGPPVRPSVSFANKLKQYKKLGFDGVQFHDDDAVPNVDSKAPREIEREAREMRKMLRGEG